MSFVSRTRLLNVGISTANKSLRNTHKRATSLYNSQQVSCVKPQYVIGVSRLQNLSLSATVMDSGDKKGSDEKMVAGDQPVADEKIVAGDQPVAEEKIVAGDQPVAEEKMVAGDQPVTEEVVAGDKPVADDKVVAGDQPKDEEKVVVGDQPVDKEKVVASDHSVNEEVATGDKPVADEKVVAGDQPEAEEKVVVGDQPEAEEKVEASGQTQSDGKTESEDNTEAEGSNTHSDTDTVKQEIYMEAMKFVNEHGWSRKSLSLGAEAAGYAGVAEGMFNGGEELVVCFIQDCNMELVEYLQEMAEMQNNPETKIPVPQFIRNAVEFRLRMLIPYIQVWPQGLALLHSPMVIKDTVSISTKMVDDIWYYAGDRSTDINWYTKRGLLAKLYASTQLKMLSDNSPDFNDTWDFLDRRMADIKVMGSMAQNLSKIPQNIAEVGSIGLNTILNIAGIGQNKRS